MNNLNINLLWMVLAFNTVNAYYFQPNPHQLYDGRMARFSPKKALWRQLPSPQSSEKPTLPIEHDQFPAASEHESYHNHGRVQIKVYRGPDDDHEDFAPYGFWIKQPADDGY